MNLRIRLQDGWRRFKTRLGIRSYLCDRCIYNNPRDCRHRVRPFATICEDHTPRHSRQSMDAHRGERGLL
jgi:hypothetical protein